MYLANWFLIHPIWSSVNFISLNSGSLVWTSSQGRGKGEMTPGSGCLAGQVNTWGWATALTPLIRKFVQSALSHRCKGSPATDANGKVFNHIFQLTLRFAWWLWYERSQTCRWEAAPVTGHWWLGTEHLQAPTPGCACSIQVFWMLLWLSFNLYGKWIGFL